MKKTTTLYSETTFEHSKRNAVILLDVAIVVNDSYTGYLPICGIFIMVQSINNNVFDLQRSVSYCFQCKMVTDKK